MIITIGNILISIITDRIIYSENRMDNMCENSENKNFIFPRWVLIVEKILLIILGIILLGGCIVLLVCSEFTVEYIVCVICLTVIICLFLILHTILTLKIMGYEFELELNKIELESEENKANNTVNQPQVV